MKISVSSGGLFLNNNNNNNKTLFEHATSLSEGDCRPNCHGETCRAMLKSISFYGGLFLVWIFTFSISSLSFLQFVLVFPLHVFLFSFFAWVFSQVTTNQQKNDLSLLGLAKTAYYIQIGGKEVRQISLSKGGRLTKY